MSLLGGEPFEEQNRPALVSLLEKVRERFPNKTVWCYTGYTFDKDLLCWLKEGRPYAEELLRQIDVLVDGEFILAKKNLRLKFRGSENQRIINVPKSLEAGRIILEME